MRNNLKYAAMHTYAFTRANTNMLNIINVILGYPLHNPGHNCVVVDPAAQYLWQNTRCSKKLGYICYSNVDEERLLTQGKAMVLFVHLHISDSVCLVMLFLFLIQLLRQDIVWVPGFPSTATAFDSCGLRTRGLTLKDSVGN